MKPVFGLLLALSIFAGGNLPSFAQDIKLGTLAPEGSPWHEALLDLAVAWKEVSNGKINLRIYAGGVIGDEPDMVRKMRVGQLHAAALSGKGLTGIAADIMALQMPMMFQSDRELDCVRDSVGERLEGALEAKGFKLLTWASAGWVRIFAQKPVVTPEDLKSLKIFTWAGNATGYEAFKAAGLQPVPLPVPEILMGLQSGLIQAFAATPVAALSFQWFGLAKHMTDMKWAPLVVALVITRKTWQDVDEGLKPGLIELARDAGARLRGEMPRIEEDAVKAMENFGLVRHHVPPEAVAEWEHIARVGLSAVVGPLVPMDAVTEVERARNECRSNS